MKQKFNLGCYKSPYDKRDFLVTTLVKDIMEDLPAKFTVRGKMSPVKNQENEGACAGFAGVAVKEYQEKIDYGFSGDEYVDLSERFLYEEAKDISGHSEGTTLIAIAKVLINLGVCEDKFWKYIPREPEQPLPGAYHNALKFKVEPAYVRITTEDELKASIVKYGAVLIGVMVFDTWNRQKDGHIPNFTWFEKILSWFGIGLLGGHGICLIGYDDETQEYEFKNSWGEEWGDKGYGYITYEHMRETLMDAICLIDIDDPEDFKPSELKQVKDLSYIERKKAWV